HHAGAGIAGDGPAQAGRRRHAAHADSRAVLRRACTRSPRARLDRRARQARSLCQRLSGSGPEPTSRTPPSNERRRITMKLYGFGPARSLRALWALKELDADFEFVPVKLQAGEHKRPEFLRLNPAGKIPVLVDGDIVIPESAAIVMYLANKYPD